MFFKGKLWRKTSGEIIESLNDIPKIKNGKIVIALSGGQDSVFLLASFLELKKKFGFELFPVHIDHHLLKEDQLYKKIAIKIGEKAGVECVVLKALSQKKKTNLENWMREERYRLLEEYRKKIPADFIAIAHHKKDLAESILLHLLRGCSLTGLKGMATKRGKIIRPLLAVDKKDIETLMKETNFPYYNDKLNYSKKNTRSKIRFKLLPYLEKNFDPQIENHLFNLSKTAQEHQRWLQKEVEKLVKKYTKNDQDQFILSIKTFTKIDPYLQKSLLRQIIKKLSPTEELSTSATQKLLYWINQKKGGQLFFKTTQAKLQKGQVTFSKRPKIWTKPNN